MQIRKNFIALNESFICKNCGHKNEKLKGSYRNHCQKCLYSLHVDKDLPGDRLSDCKGLMTPISINQNGKKGWIISHKCKKCSKMIPNLSAEDDDFDTLILLTQKTNESARIKKIGR
ncbi:MAG: RNHCP domain-containing protein [Candidatus Gracilibacteria bacterium]|nr:RNHCP domain-containing protein [Candidatus Gracilibacteria bacterium]